MVTSQKFKETRKGGTHSMHHFWKEDLSANNSLPNFADDLNIHKSPSVSKSSTSNIIANNLSSLDKNFLKLNSSEQPFILNLPILILFLSQNLSINLFLRTLLSLVIKLNVD